MLALVYGCKRYHHYIFGKQVTIETDHKPLLSLFKKPLAQCPMRLQRMLLDLQIYDINLIYKPGKEMYIADALSRLPISSVYLRCISPEYDAQINFLNDNFPMSSDEFEQYKQETNKDLELQNLLNYVSNGWPNSRSLCKENVKRYWNFRDETGREYLMTLKI